MASLCRSTGQVAGKGADAAAAAAAAAAAERGATTHSPTMQSAAVAARMALSGHRPCDNCGVQYLNEALQMLTGQGGASRWESRQA
mmetsp:Transcript_151640/g.275926  ORF Transcript_151640/g.275926 Transcript_151640/m.275926 type:complete len:86 (+) Transcript_151640:298-555(+)